ncbi:MAG: hypothetical protein ACREOU_00445 [Candidatus Eiseniibacteriota bacterium]
MAEVSFRIDPANLEQMNRRLSEYLGLNYERSTLARIVEEFVELEAEEERSWSITVRYQGRDLMLEYKVALDAYEEPEVFLEGPDGFIEELDQEVVQPVLEEYEA